MASFVLLLSNLHETGCRLEGGVWVIYICVPWAMVTRMTLRPELWLCTGHSHQREMKAFSPLSRSPSLERKFAQVHTESEQLSSERRAFTSFPGESNGFRFITLLQTPLTGHLTLILISVNAGSYREATLYCRAGQTRDLLRLWLWRVWNIAGPELSHNTF